MAAGQSARLVSVVQRALSDGPVSQDDLLIQLQQAGIRVDLGLLWETCRTHRLADLRNDLWVPMDWVPQAEAATPGPAGTRTEPSTRPSGTNQQTRNPAARRAAERVQQLADLIGLGAPEPVPPVGPVPAGWADVARSAREALDQELARVRSRRTETDVALLDGQQTGVTATGRLVRYEAQSEIGSAEGNKGTLIVREQQFDVYVISVFGAVVTLSVPAEAPVTREATLRMDMSWLLIVQSKRLRQLVGGGPGFNAAAALAAVTPEAPAEPTAAAGPSDTVRPLTPQEADRLNDGQRRAVQLALTPGVTWLWGPPGTGKTTTISALVAALAARGKRVLLAAPTNAALDVAVTSVLNRAPHLATDGTLVRVGQPTDTLTRQEILVDVVAAARGAVVADERVDVGRRLKQARSELGELRMVKGQLSDEQQRHRSALERQIADLVALAEELDELLVKVRRMVCRQATVVAATAHQTVLDTVGNLTFDVVVLDEASMTNAALAMLVAGAGNGHTVIAGDFRQLPPVAVAETPAAREWLHKSPFEKAGVVRAVQDGRAPARLAALTEQYRMRPAIGHVVSTAFYPESPLVTAEAVTTRPRTSRIRWATGQLLVLDTSGLRARTARRQGSVSRYNLMHAQLVAGLLGSATTQTRDLAMITPFTAQARLLESLLPDFGLDGWAASTVHRFQGGERDIVVYDTVDTGHGIPKLHSWFTDLDPDSTGTRLLNVAASRAKDHLVVVGAFDQLHRSGSSADPLWRFFAHLLDQAVRLPWQDVIGMSDGATEHVPPTQVLPRLQEDLTAAASVEMWLPSAALVGLPKLIPALRSLPPAGGEVRPDTIWVEPDRDGYLSAEALHARREGVNIRPTTPILESSAVVGDVVWSAGGTLLGPEPGVVLRTESAAFADLVRRTQRRRRSARTPGTGQLGDDCGRCQRALVRFELPRPGAPEVRYECPSCDRLTRREAFRRHPALRR